MHHLEDVVRPVTLIRSPRLSEALKADVVLASETFQYTGSFKFRAAYNVASKVANKHLLTASSGNFGQALAYSCKLLGKRCSVVMPKTSSQTKIEAVKAYGAEVDLIDISEVSRAARIEQLAKEFPRAYVASPYDDDLVIEGNETLGLEILSRGEFDMLICPIGGGGLASGLAQALQKTDAKIELFAAEPAMANDAAESLREGRLVVNTTEAQTMADGARTVSLGRRNWEILRTALTGVIEVEENDIARGLRSLYDLANLKCEPTGALAVGALLTERESLKEKRICCVVSGGNVDAQIYARLISS